MSDIFGSVWWLIVTLGVLITFHEYGHFVVARRCGVKVLKFSVGFGPALWSRFDRHGTQFVIAAIPLGGYVKMLDTREVDGVVGPTGLAGAFDRKSVGQRMAVTAAGPAFNLIFTLAALWLMFVVGKPDYLPVVGQVDHLAASAGFKTGDRIQSIAGHAVDTWTDASQAIFSAALDRRDLALVVTDGAGGTHQRALPLSKLPAELKEQDLAREIGLTPRPPPAEPLVRSVTASSPAASAGLRSGDRIESVGGEAIADWRQISDAIQKRASADQPVEITILRDGQRLTLAVKPSLEPADPAVKDAQPRWIVGIAGPTVEPDATRRYGPVAALGQAFQETWSQTTMTLTMLGRMVTGQASLKNLSGVITIGQAANESAKLGFAWFLSFLAAISLSLAILNLLPIPILDGGGLLYYLIELIKGSPLSERVQVAGQYVGLVLLMGLMSLALYNDILRNVS